MKTSSLTIPILEFHKAALRLKKVVNKTPLSFNHNLSRKYQCNVYLKREDLQVVRSYKLRGAYNMMSTLPQEQLERGVVCASAGNHAQGFAYSCRKLNVQGVVFMPVITPNQKINQTKMFGEDFIEVRLIGDTFDDCAEFAPRGLSPVGSIVRDGWHPGVTAVAIANGLQPGTPILGPFPTRAVGYSLARFSGGSSRNRFQASNTFCRCSGVICWKRW